MHRKKPVPLQERAYLNVGANEARPFGLGKFNCACVQGAPPLKGPVFACFSFPHRMFKGHYSMISRTVRFFTFEETALRMVRMA
jgi:hypothetical protein